ncbi:MAG: signal peptidase I [Gemmatimonadaceae bacterium]
MTAAVWLIAAVLLAAVLWTTRFGTRWPSVYFMTGASMEPTIGAERYFLTWSPPGQLARGDLVIFRFMYGTTEYEVLRRVVAFGGDTVSMRAGALFVNGARQPWPFRVLEPRAWRSTYARDSNLYDWGPWVVSSDSIMLLSDTRDILGWPDSRFTGFISTNDVVARATRTLDFRRLR